MKKLTTQSIALAILVVIALFAGGVSAGNPAIPNPGGFSANNTPFPVDVGTSYQIKGTQGQSGGGLSVEAFTARAAASFDKIVGIQGILTGNPTSAINSNLSFGAGSNGTGNRVDLSILGTTYATELTAGDRAGGLYSDAVKATTGLNELCAKQDGTIIVCPAGVVHNQVTYSGTLSISNAFVSGTTSILGLSSALLWTNLTPANFPINANLFVDAKYNTYVGPLTVSASVSQPARIEIWKNGAYSGVCKGQLGTSNQNYTIPSVTFDGNDSVLIKLMPGNICP